MSNIQDSDMKYWKENIEPGHVLLTEKPFVYCLSSKNRTEYCDYCFNQADFNYEIRKCSACKYVYYCNKVCQKAAWPLHKGECKSFKRIAPRIIPDAARTLARLIRILNKDGKQVRSYYTDIQFRMFKDLMSHYPNLKKDQKRIEHFHSLYLVLQELMDGEVIPNPVDLLGMFGRMCINSFNICNDAEQVLGTGIYLAASILDHSCDPNAVAKFKGTNIEVRAVKPMKYLNWSEVKISYIDVLNTTKHRVEELERIYYFTCICPKCSLPDPIEMEAAACPNRKCDNPISTDMMKEGECSKCGKLIPPDFKETFREVNELTDLHLQNMKDLAYLDACEVCLKKQEGVLHSLNIKKVKTLDLAFESCINLGKFDRAITYGSQLVQPFLKYYGKFHPVTGVFHYKFGAVCNWLQSKEMEDEARTHMKLSYDIIKVTHGLQSRIYLYDMLPLLSQLGLRRT